MILQTKGAKGLTMAAYVVFSNSKFARTADKVLIERSPIRGRIQIGLPALTSEVERHNTP